MARQITRGEVEAFYKAYAARDVETISQFLADDVEWTISGPIDVLPFCGTRHGKAAVLELIEREVPSVFRVYSFAVTALLVDGEQAAILARLAARGADGRTISYRLSHFIRFHDGKIVRCLSLIDSFNAVEQVLGHSLTVQQDMWAQLGDLIAV